VFIVLVAKDNQIIVPLLSKLFFAENTSWTGCLLCLQCVALISCACHHFVKFVLPITPQYHCLTTGLCDA